ncbi:MAG: hypothetical protein GY950_01600, partial [bacterium]|nr:hypothetical protein [bacterium]
MTVLISYAHKDQPYVDVFTKEFEKHADFSRDIRWITRTDKDAASTGRWDEGIRLETVDCDFAFLMISPAFPAAGAPGFVEQSAFDEVLKQAGEERFLFFPVLLEACDLASQGELNKRQFFVPKGVDYGKPWIKQLAYTDLVEPAPNGKGALPNPNRKRYMAALVKALNHTLQDYKPKLKRKKEKAPEIEKNNYFKLVKPVKDLEPEDILGPGKRAEINRDFYWRRKPDEILVEHLKNGRSVLILGNSLSGKTRALYEAVKRLGKTTVLVPMDQFVVGDDFELPKTDKTQEEDTKYIALFDDIDYILNKNAEENLEKFLQKLMEKGAVIAATCRRGNEYRAFDSLVAPHFRNHFERVYINRMTENQEKAFNVFFSKKTKELGQLDEKAFDGTIGSYFMDLTVMRDRYRDLEKIMVDYPITIPEKLPREILKALKYFYYTENTEGKSSFRMHKIKDFCERSLLGKRPGPKRREQVKKKGKDEWQQQLDVFASPVTKEEFTPAEWNNAVTVLSHSDYDLNFIQPRGPEIHVEEVYLEKVVSRGLQLNRIITILNTIYRGEDLQRLGFLTSIFGFTKLINLAHSAEEAYRVFHKLKAMGIHPTVITFNALINKAASFKDALSFLDKMKENKIVPDQVTFSSILNKAHTFKHSLSCLDKMKENNIKPDEIIFNSLIHKADTFSSALTFLDKMKESGLKPNESTFSHLIGKADTFSHALTLLDKMKENHMKPHELTFKSLVNKTETFTDTLTLLEKMKESDVQPGEEAFNSLLDKAKTFGDTLIFLDKMKENGLKADSFTFTSLINKAETYENAAVLLEKMKEHDVKPNVITFTSLMSRTDNFKDIIGLLTQVKAQGIQPNKFTVNMLSGKVRQDPRQYLEHLFERFPPEEIFDDFLFNRLISEACKTDECCLELVVPHIDVIIRQKESILIFYARLLEYKGDADNALKLLEHIETKTFDYYNIKANCVKATDFNQAIELYKNAMETTKEKDVGQKAIVHNNTAQLIFDHHRTEMYGEAVEHCKAALKLRTYTQFPYPGDLLLLFTIHESRLNNLKENVATILKTYKIN